MYTITGTTGNTDVGIALGSTNTGSNRWNANGQTNTVTGTAGDIRTSTPIGTVILTHAQVNATGFRGGKDDLIVGAAGGPVALLGKFSAALGSIIAPVFGYLNDDLSAGGAGNAQPNHYPTSLRLITRLRIAAPVGTGTAAITGTLYKNGVATAMTCTIAGAQPAGATAVDAAHPILFLDGDTFDVRIDVPINVEGAEPIVATIEGPV